MKRGQKVRFKTRRKGRKRTKSGSIVWSDPKLKIALVSVKGDPYIKSWKTLGYKPKPKAKLHFRYNMDLGFNSFMKKRALW